MKRFKSRCHPMQRRLMPRFSVRNPQMPQSNLRIRIFAAMIMQCTETVQSEQYVTGWHDTLNQNFGTYLFKTWIRLFLKALLWRPFQSCGWAALSNFFPVYVIIWAGHPRVVSNSLFLSANLQSIDRSKRHKVPNTTVKLVACSVTIIIINIITTN